MRRLKRMTNGAADKMAATKTTEKAATKKAATKKAATKAVTKKAATKKAATKKAATKKAATKKAATKKAATKKAATKKAETNKVATGGLAASSNLTDYLAHYGYSWSHNRNFCGKVETSLSLDGRELIKARRQEVQFTYGDNFHTVWFSDDIPLQHSSFRTDYQDFRFFQKSGRVQISGVTQSGQVYKITLGTPTLTS